MGGPQPGATPATSESIPARWQGSPAEVMQRLDSRQDGLSSQEAQVRGARLGPNVLQARRKTDSLSLLMRQFESPIVLILVFATVISGLLGDATDAAIILAIIVLSALLGFWQERGSTRAVEALLAVVEVKAEVRRGGATLEVPVADIVPGDIVLLNAGDVVPGDCLVLESRSLLVDEATLTGETYPVEKTPGTVPVDSPTARRTNAVFMGTHVASGSGVVLVVDTGRSTVFGSVSARLRERPATTGFERGMTAFGYLLVRAMVVLVVSIFVVNLLLARPLIDSALFSLALAVGLTPQLLPAIVTISLSQGARMMARQRVIVKRLDAIEDFGAMSILCTDKTGTMTTGSVELSDAQGIDGKASATVRRMAYLNAHLQTGFTNPIDTAIVAGAAPADAGDAQRLDELPYDFTRKLLSILVKDGGTVRIVTKGAFDNVLAACSEAQTQQGSAVALDKVRADLVGQYEALSGQGYRVLGVATRAMPGATKLTIKDEANLAFCGFLSFLDPPKPDAGKTLADLAHAGISVRMITGDNRLVAGHVAKMVGLQGPVLAGADIEALDDATLATRVGETAIFAEVEPIAKERIIRALRATGRVVGYLGDGINDAPALHAADVGISVETAVDVAKEAAAIVLLDKDLRVLLDGVRQGRQTFANTMKYVFTTTSANFGNMLSMAFAAATLPFLPLLADQILLINFLTDFPSTTIATDTVDEEQLEQPESWDIAFVRRFMLVFGAISSVFDLLTFLVLRVGFAADAVAFRSGWFLESVATELAVLFVLRTRRSFFRSRPSRLLLVSSIAVAVLTVAIPYSPVAGLLGLDGPSLLVLGALAAITAAYVGATELAKGRFYRDVAARSRATA